MKSCLVLFSSRFCASHRSHKNWTFCLKSLKWRGCFCLCKIDNTDMMQICWTLVLIGNCVWKKGVLAWGYRLTTSMQSVFWGGNPSVPPSPPSEQRCFQLWSSSSFWLSISLPLSWNTRLVDPDICTQTQRVINYFWRKMFPFNGNNTPVNLLKPF